MKIRCQYSGELIRVEHFQSYTTNGLHPIFYLSTKQLLLRAKDWSAHNYTTTENKLLFLALLNKTGCVKFECPADPGNSTVQKNMIPLFKVTGISDLLNESKIPLPNYNITPLNYELSNIHNWIQSWNEAKSEFFTPSLKFSLQRKQEKLETVLDKLLSNPYKTSENFSGRLAKWTFEVSDVPSSKKDYWWEIFTTKTTENKIFKYPIEDVKEMLDHIETALYCLYQPGQYGWSYANRALDHLRKIETTIKGGVIGTLSGGGLFRIVDYNDEDHYEESEEDKINFSEFKKSKKLLNQAPSEEPKLENYQGRIKDYMRAKAAWTLANNIISSNQKSVLLRQKGAENTETQTATKD